MIRMSDRYNQVVVGEDYKSPIAACIKFVRSDGKNSIGQVELNGKRYRVTNKFGDVWVLEGGLSMTNIYEGVENEQQAM